MLFRHHASLGGLNIWVLVLQKRFGWARRLGADGYRRHHLIASLAMIRPQAHRDVDPGCARALNLTLALNHRPGRYVAF